MSSDDLDVATRFLDVLAAARKSGDGTAVDPLLAHDVEWSTPMREFRGIDEVRERLVRVVPSSQLEIDYEVAELVDLGDGRVVSDVREVYRLKDSGDFAYARERRIELTIRERRIAKYEMQVVG